MSSANAAAVQDSPKTAEAKPEVIADAIPEIKPPEVKAPEVPVPEEKKPDVTPGAEDKKVTEAADVPEVKPVVYDLKLPKDSRLKMDELESISSYAKEKGLSNEQAQFLVDREHAAKERTYAQIVEESKQKSHQWVDQIKVDAEIGGEPVAKNMELAKRVFQKFGSESLMKTLNETGLGNHPELVRLGVRLGKAMSEDQLVMGSQSSPGKKTLAERLYKDTPK